MVLIGVVVIKVVMVIMVIWTDPGHTGQTGETSQRGQTDLTLGVDFPGNLPAWEGQLSQFLLCFVCTGHL